MSAPSLDEMIEAVREAVYRAEYRASGGLVPQLAALRAALSQLEASRWRPISEAPKDRQLILSRIVNGSVEQIDVGGWEVYEGRDDPGGYDPPFRDWTSNYGIEEPTHWIPLPSPPASDSEGGEGE